MPSPNTLKIETLAWNVITKYAKDNPKPRISARTRHRMKMWLVGRIPDMIGYKGAPNDYIIQLSQDRIDDMMDYARHTIDD